MKYMVRVVFRILSNIYDGAFCKKIVNGEKSRTIFAKMLHQMYDRVQNIPLHGGSNLFKLRKSLGTVYLHELLKKPFSDIFRGIEKEYEEEKG